jgi:carboxymethylenebutenolidase
MPARTRCVTDRFTSGGRPVAADVFLPPAPGRHPAVLILHGTDGLLPHVRADIASFAEALAARGVAAVLPHYFERTATAAGSPALAAIPTHLEAWAAACGDALRFVQAHARVDGGRLGVLGFSLGAHLALELAMAPPSGTALKGAVDFFGPTLAPPLRGDLAALPPVQIHHGTADATVPLEHSVHLIDGLRSEGRTAGLGYDFHTYPGQGHGFVGADLTTSRSRSVAFLEAIL